MKCLNCPICAIRSENIKLQEGERQEKIKLGLSYTTDNQGTLPIKISLYSRTTKEQWRKMLDLCKEIETQGKPAKGYSLNRGST